MGISTFVEDFIASLATNVSFKTIRGSKRRIPNYFSIMLSKISIAMHLGSPSTFLALAGIPYSLI